MKTQLREVFIVQGPDLTSFYTRWEKPWRAERCLRLQLVSTYFKADGNSQIALNLTGLGPRCQTSFDRRIKQRERGGQEYIGKKQTVFYR